MGSIQIFKAQTRDSGERLDKWLCERLQNISRKQIKHALDGGRVRINGRRVLIAGWEIEDGDEIEISIPEAPCAEEQPPNAEPGPAGARGNRANVDVERRARPKSVATVGESLDRFLKKAGSPRKKAREADAEGLTGDPRAMGRGRIKVYYEDRDLIVVEKPAGIISVPAHTGKDSDSMLALVKAYMRRKFKGSKFSFVAPLHRLDMETSGIMVFALSKQGQRLSSQFKNHSINRTYTAVVYGQPKGDGGVIDKPLEKGSFESGKKVREAEESEGVKAVTEYRVKERYKDAALLDIVVRTGRTHQIRVHLASEGHPIIGDALYAPATSAHTIAADEAEKHIGFRRHALHASSLGFKHPSGGKKHLFHSPLPADMRGLVDALRCA